MVVAYANRQCNYPAFPLSNIIPEARIPHSLSQTVIQLP